MILSGGNQDLTIPGKNVKIEVSLSLERKDLSGQSSDSSFVNAGEKAQKIKVSTQIPLTEKEKLTQLAMLARACDTNNEPVVYAMSNPLCLAMGIRQVIFSGQFSVVESSTLRVFDVSFELQEYMTISEKREERANENAARIEPIKDGQVNVGTINPAKINQIARETRE